MVVTAPLIKYVLSVLLCSIFFWQIALKKPIQINTVSARNVSQVWASSFHNHASERLVVFQNEITVLRMSSLE